METRYDRKSICLWAVILLSSMLLFVLTCSKSSTGDDEDADKTGPVAVSDLTVIQVTSSTLTLQWTTPTDYRDDHSKGMVDRYDIRISYDSITPQNFASAYSFDSVPGVLPAEMMQQWTVEELEPDSQYYLAIKSCDDKGNWSAVSNCCKGHCEPVLPAVFPDDSLEKAIREHIHKPTGEIYTSDVDTISMFVAVQRGIVNLSGLENFVSVRNLFLSRNSISDLTPLANLTQLTGFDLALNQISDITPLASLVNAGSFNLSWNNISNLSPLGSLVHLQTLDISANPVTDIGPLASMTQLHQLFMFSTQVTDFSPLYGLQYLADVHFGLNNLGDISFMSHLTHLKIAQLGNNSISSLEPLDSLVGLEGLGLANNNVTEVGPLAGLVNLRDLDLRANQITDIQALVNNAGLGTGDSLRLVGNPLSQQALDVQIPALEARGVGVLH